MPIDVRPGQKVAVLGDYESGKSTLAAAIWLQQPAGTFYDTVHEVGGRLRHVPRVRSLEKLAELVARPDAPRHVLYQPPPDLASDFDHLDDFTAIAARRRRALVAVDELHVFFEDGVRQRAPPGVSKFLRFGHKPAFGQNGFMAITHRPADVPKVFFLGHHFFLFHIDLPHDIKSLTGFVGPRVADRLPSLPPHHFGHVIRGANGGVKWYGPLPERYAAPA